jgi:hypothetical protein
MRNSNYIEPKINQSKSGEKNTVHGEIRRLKPGDAKHHILAVILEKQKWLFFSLISKCEAVGPSDDTESKRNQMRNRVGSWPGYWSIKCSKMVVDAVIARAGQMYQ